MVWSPDAAYVAGLDFFTTCVARLGRGDLLLASPCSEWTALDVLGHVGAGIDFGTRLLRGERPTWAPLDPPGDGVTGDPHRWWDLLASSARQSVAAVDLAAQVETPNGKRTIGDGLSFPALDLYVHGWDLTRSVGLDTAIPTEAIEFAHDFLDPLPAERLRHPGVFSAPVVGAPNLTTTQAFIAWTGRDPAWLPPGDKSPSELP